MNFSMTDTTDQSKVFIGIIQKIFVYMMKIKHIFDTQK